MIRLLKKLVLADQRGIAVFTVVAISAVCIILAFCLAFVVESEQVMTVRDEKSNRAFHIAEAGASNYIWYLNHPGAHPHPGLGGGNWARCVNEQGVVIGEYHVEVTETEAQSADRRTVTFEVTGRLASDSSIEQTIRVKARKPTFLDNLWFTNKEGGVYWWGKNETVGWAGDECFGPFRTNGDLWIWGKPVFHDLVSFSDGVYYTDPTTKKVDYLDPTKKEGQDRLNRLEADGVFSGGWSHVDTLNYPEANTSLATDAKANGYYYEGITSIRLHGTEMNIVEVTPGSNSSNPYDPPLGNNLSLPGNNEDGGVVYVNGDVYIQGELNGKLTVAANNSIYITDNLTYADNTHLDPTKADCSENVLGLVANGNVYIHNGVTSAIIPKDTNREVDAAIMALKSFALENVSSANILGKLTVKGTVVQELRGEVGKFNKETGAPLTGFLKNYIYDERLEYQQYEPPSFLKPTTYNYERVSWQEVH